MADTTCPHGHASTWDDFCSVCGDSMDGGVAPATPAAAAAVSGGACLNCSTPFGVEDVFCESCGYDFATGTLPGADPVPESKPAPVAATPVAPQPAGSAGPSEATAREALGAEANDPESSASESAPLTPGGALVAIVSCDREHFDTIVGSAGLEYPDPEPAPTSIALGGGKVLIGRHNQSRGVYPEIDIDASTGDPAASTRHAMLREISRGVWTLTDLNSTNGTMLDDATSPLAPGTAVPVTAGSVIYVGAFTRITLASPPN